MESMKFTVRILRTTKVFSLSFFEQNRFANLHSTGMHNWPNGNAGTLSTKGGPVMAHVTEFEVKVIGVGGHGSQPHRAVDAILAASTMINTLQSILSRNVPSMETAVLSVCFIHSGTVSNIIPTECVFGGTIRDLNPAVWELITSRFRTIGKRTLDNRASLTAI
jgi:hippurate hydrolase